MNRSLMMLLLSVFIASCQTTSVSVPPAPEGYTLLWEDHFDSNVIDTTHWTVGTLRDPHSGDLVPGAKGDHLLNDQYAGYITSEDSYIEKGKLILRNQKRPYSGTNPVGHYDYTSSWVMTMHKVFFNTGYVEIKARFPAGDKVWPALWLIAEDLTWGPEWDMFEYFGQRDDIGFDNMGLHLYSASNKWHSSWLKNFDAEYHCDEWHVYGFEWTRDQAVWYIDGKKVHTLLASQSEGWPDENMYLVINNGQRTEAPDATTVWPNTLSVDYVKVYQKKQK